jgi:hypothetical protein
MKKTFYGIAAAVGIGLLASCSGSAETKSDLQKSLEELKKLNEVKYMKGEVDSVDFTIDIPDYMTPTSSLDVGRPFQFMNAYKEQYIVASYEPVDVVKPLLEVMDNSKKSMLEKYADYNWDILKENVSITSQEKEKKMTIDGMQALEYEFNGTVEGVTVPINYYVTFIEGKENIYFVMTWTLESKKEEFRPIAEKMIRSFRVKK